MLLPNRLHLAKHLQALRYLLQRVHSLRTKLYNILHSILFAGHWGTHLGNDFNCRSGSLCGEEGREDEEELADQLAYVA
jgi:hypothetical protein